jgi:hypothetical protein
MKEVRGLIKEGISRLQSVFRAKMLKYEHFKCHLDFILRDILKC